MHGPQTVVLCHGTFDLLHLGHIRHLEEAKAQGDKLVVSVTCDHYIKKGIGRPRFTVEERIEALKALACVDDVIISDGPDAIASINAIKPSVYVKGTDYEAVNDDRLNAEVEAVKALGGKFYTTKAQKFSSSRLLNGERFTSEVASYLDHARSRGFLSKIKEAFEAADKLHIAFVGENITDEYCYVRGLSKPSKEFMLATVMASKEEYHGGIVAASRHCDWPHKSVVTSWTPIKKTRYVDADFNRKLFEVYSDQRADIILERRHEFRQHLASAMRNCEVIIVMDFGHGLFEFFERRAVEHANFLAVNAQTNAGNAGFNPVTLYHKAHFVCVDEPEARLATTLQTAKIDDVARNLKDRIECDSLVITKGRNGSLCSNGNLAEVPAFTIGGIDTMGAGDAFLATSAPLLAAGLDLEAAAFVGNVAGAIKTTIVGHRSHVTRDELMQNVEALLA